MGSVTLPEISLSGISLVPSPEDATCFFYGFGGEDPVITGAALFAPLCCILLCFEGFRRWCQLNCLSDENGEEDGWPCVWGVWGGLRTVMVLLEGMMARMGAREEGIEDSDGASKWRS